MFPVSFGADCEARVATTSGLALKPGVELQRPDGRILRSKRKLVVYNETVSESGGSATESDSDSDSPAPRCQLRTRESSPDYSPRVLPFKKRSCHIHRHTQVGAEVAQTPIMLNIFTQSPHCTGSPGHDSGSQPQQLQSSQSASRLTSASISVCESKPSPMKATPSNTGHAAVSAPTPGGFSGTGTGGKKQSALNYRQKSGASSHYRGVTRHSTTGRYEAHLWDSSCIRPKSVKGGRARGRQVYLGGYASELAAAHAYDLAAIKYWSESAVLNFPWESYALELASLQAMSREEVVSMLKRNSTGFSRGRSCYRGVTRHHQAGKFEARIGRVAGNRYLYLGTFPSEKEAAQAYDRAAIKFRGKKAVTNFGMKEYTELFSSTGAVHVAMIDELLNPCSPAPVPPLPAHLDQDALAAKAVEELSPEFIRVAALRVETPVVGPCSTPAAPAGPGLLHAVPSMAALRQLPMPDDSTLANVEAWGHNLYIDSHFDEDFAMEASSVLDGSHMHADIFNSINSDLYNNLIADFADPPGGSEPWWTMLPQIMGTHQ